MTNQRNQWHYWSWQHKTGTLRLKSNSLEVNISNAQTEVWEVLAHPWIKSMRYYKHFRLCTWRGTIHKTAVLWQNHISSGHGWIRCNLLMRSKMFLLCKLPHFQVGKLQSGIQAGRERVRKQKELTKIWASVVYSKTRRQVEKIELLRVTAKYCWNWPVIMDTKNYKGNFKIQIPVTNLERGNTELNQKGSKDAMG